MGRPRFGIACFKVFTPFLARPAPDAKPAGGAYRPVRTETALPQGPSYYHPPTNTAENVPTLVLSATTVAHVVGAGRRARMVEEIV